VLESTIEPYQVHQELHFIFLIAKNDSISLSPFDDVVTVFLSSGSRVYRHCFGK
jgi:hypothetical protein